MSASWARDAKIESEKKMSIKAVAWAFEQSLDGDAVAKLVLLAICDRYNDEYNKAWPNIEWISRAADCSARTVIRKIKKLETSGYLSVESAPIV